MHEESESMPLEFGKLAGVNLEGQLLTLGCSGPKYHMSLHRALAKFFLLKGLLMINSRS